MRSQIILWAALALTLIVDGCSGRVPLGTAAMPVSSFAPALNSDPKLMIFGGRDHRTYLGCLNCSQYATDSVMNKYGTSGSPYSTESIFNHYSEFGSKYSTESACNQFASDPPFIVDGDGTYYGRLTLNRYAKGLGDGAEYMGWLAAICEQ